LNQLFLISLVYIEDTILIIMSETTFNQDFKKVANETYNMCGYDLDNFESLLLAYREVMAKREPYAVKVLDAIDLIQSSIEFD
jgi:hypothetical protein